MDRERVEGLRLLPAHRHGLELPDPTPTPAEEPVPVLSSLAGAESLVAAFGSVAGRHPDRPAVRCGEHGLSYRELDAASTQLAGAVASRAGTPARPVAILLERSVDMVVAALAILKTGSAYVPLDSATPAARLRVILEDAAPSMVITSRILVSSVPADVPVVLVDDPAPGRVGFVSPRVERSDRAYIIFTSGTTGRPKGVEVTHGNVLNLLTCTDPLFGFGSNDVWSLFHSFSFDFSVWEMWGALLFGGCVVVVPEDVAMDPPAFRRLLAEERVTVLSQTPTAFSQLIAEDRRTGDRLGLRWVVLGGEALHFSELRAWVDKYGDAAPQLINMYGITETTVHASYRRVLAGDLDAGRSVIGHPLPGLDFILVGENLVPAAAGQVGEIVVTGPSVARGYLARPELTRERFIELSSRDGALVRGYRSGDLAALTSAGEYEYRGRRDDQVKIRGHRIELGEVEGALRGLEAVAGAAVVAHDLPELGTSLVAYVVAAGAGEVSPVELRQNLKRVLPACMIPSRFVPVPELPLTQNGKLDRKALPDPTDATGSTENALAAEADGDVQAGIVAILGRLLRMTEVDPTADFFDLGGHSLLATRLLAAVRADLGVEVTLREFFRAPTARALAGLVRERRCAGQQHVAGQMLVMHKAPDSEYQPMTSAQERLYFLAQLDPGSTAYNLNLALRVQGALDAAALARAFEAVIARHDSLRTVVRVVDSEPVQLILPARRFALRVEELATAPGQRWEESLDQLRQEEGARPFQLDRELMVRVRLVRIAEDLHALLVTMHHIASDGWSNAVFSRELGIAYRHFTHGRPAAALPLAPLPYTYADYAHGMARWLGSPATEQDLDYWRRRLANMPAMHGLALDRPRPEWMSYTGNTLAFPVQGQALRALRRLCRQENVTLFMLLAAAFAVLLSRRSGSEDIAVGTPVANRPLAELDGLIGLFVNIVVLRVQLGGVTSFRELLARVRSESLRDLEHQHVPFDLLVNRLEPQRSNSHLPLFQIALVVQTNEEITLDLDGLRVEPLPAEDHVAKFDLTLEATERDSDIRIVWRYNTDLFHRATVAGMAEEFEKLLFDLTTRPEAVTEPLERPSLPAPTTAAAATERGQHSGALSPLHERPVGATPVFALPGALGRGSAFAQLSASFSDRSFYAVETSNVTSSLGAGLTLEALVAGCAGEIAETAAEMAAHLVGHSLGGSLAPYLVAALAARQVRVASLTLLDSVPPAEVAVELAGGRRHQLRLFLSHLAHLFPTDVRQLAMDMLDSTKEVAEQEILAGAAELLGPSGLTLFDGDLGAAFGNYLRTCQLSWPEPEPIDCPTLLVTATEGLDGRFNGRRLGWAPYLRGHLVRTEVAATHEGMLRHPHARSLAERLGKFFTTHDAELASAAKTTGPR